MDKIDDLRMGLALRCFSPLEGAQENFTERLLGHVLAHEIGHMLSASHSSKGIMRAEWGRDDLKLIGFSMLEFSPDQAKQMRAALLHRAVRPELTQNVKLYASR